MSTIFKKIIDQEIPCYLIHEDEKFMAFLDVNPLVDGHTLVIPKIEVDYIFDLEDSLLGEMMVFAKSVAAKLKSSFDCKKIGVTVVGLEVPHAHIHLIPINSIGDMNFEREKRSFDPEYLKSIQQKILK